MFTGIIQQVGRLGRATALGGDMRFAIAASADWLVDVGTGDSIAVNGVCLTVTAVSGESFEVDLSRETLACTSLGQLEEGARLNLEKALRAGDVLGGHLVSGHVDAVSRVLDVRPDARSQRIRFALPASIAHLVAPKGSICVDGTSLTVNEVESGQFGVNIVPHTSEQTIVSDYETGTVVNLEADLIARYVARALGRDGSEEAH